MKRDTMNDGTKIKRSRGKRAAEVFLDLDFNMVAGIRMMVSATKA